MIQDEAASRWVNQSTFEAIYLLADAGEELNTIDLEINNAFDVNGNAQTMSFSASDIFAIDTRNPLVTEVIPNMNVIQGDDIGEAMFSIAVTFDEEMSNSVAPELTLNSSSPINLPLNGQSQWTDLSTYTAVYDVPVNLEPTASVDIMVQGNAKDAAGNLSESLAQTNAFSIDIVSNLNAENATSNIIFVYPNPALSGNSLTILSGSERMIRLQIVDMLGKTLVEIAPQSVSAQTIVLPECSSGIYMTLVTTENGLYKQPILINK
jgi:hypothetical protein